MKKKDIVLSSIAVAGLILLIISCCVNFWSFEISVDVWSIEGTDTEFFNGGFGMFSDMIVETSTAVHNVTKLLVDYNHGWGYVIVRAGVIVALSAALIYLVFTVLQITGSIKKQSILFRKLSASLAIVGTTAAMSGIIFIIIQSRVLTLMVSPIEWAYVDHITVDVGAWFAIFGGLIFGICGLISACSYRKSTKQKLHELQQTLSQLTARTAPVTETQTITAISTPVAKTVPLIAAIKPAAPVAAVKPVVTAAMNDIDNICNSLMKYKQMLDEGLITKEDFDAKKKQLLK